jgi:hypothetical protein
MADTTEIAPNDTIPALPPLPGVAPLVHAPCAGDGQIWPLTSAGIAVAQALTPQPPQRILLPAGSAISSITNPTATTASSPGTANNADDTPQKGNVTKCKFPDFSRAFSHDNALLSGDESDGWDVELDNIQEQIAAANNAEHEDASNMEDPVEEVQEFEYILENVAMDEEERNADEVVVYDSVTVMKKTHTVADLKNICNALNVSTSGNKAALFMRIRDCGNPLVVQIDAESFVFKQIRGEEADPSLPRWVILNPDPAPSMPGIDMLRGTETGFYGPTNVENVAEAPKFQYCCSEEEKVRRPKFVSKNPDHPTSKKGHISEAARKLLPDEIRNCRPKDFFDTQITPKFVQSCIVNTTNARASSEGAGFGGTVYTDYKNFDLEEVNKMIGLLFLNGLAPRPMFTMWFEHHNIFGNEFIAKAMNKQMEGSERSIQGIRLTTCQSRSKTINCICNSNI